MKLCNLNLSKILLFWQPRGPCSRSNDSGTYYRDADGYKGKSKDAPLRHHQSHTTLSYSALWRYLRERPPISATTTSSGTMYSGITNYEIGGSAQG